MIEVTVVQGRGLVFAAADARLLREDHRIVGTLIGALPSHPNQNIHLGLPLQLSKEELTLLLEREIVVLKSRNNYPGCFTKAEHSLHYSTMEQNLKEQVEESKRVRLKEIETIADKIVEGKIKTVKTDKSVKKKKKGKQQCETLEASVENGTEVLTTDPDMREKILEKIRSRIEPLPEECALIQTHMVNPVVRVQQEASKETMCYDCSNPGPSHALPRFTTSSWKYPCTKWERLRYMTFKHFWELGMYITNGQKFGGDFLAYPGDPSRFHSYFIVRCMEIDATLTPENLVALARLGTSVKKTVVLCSLDEEAEDDPLVVTSLEWSHWN